MKFLALLILVSSLSLQAQSLRPLKDVMSDLGDNFKIVTLGLKAGAITPKLVTASENIQKFIIEAEAITPDTILSLPNIEQEAAKVKYDQAMKDLEKTAGDFATAMKAGDLNLSKQFLAKMGEIKKQGHDAYKD